MEYFSTVWSVTVTAATWIVAKGVVVGEDVARPMCPINQILLKRKRGINRAATTRRRRSTGDVERKTFQI